MAKKPSWFANCPMPAPHLPHWQPDAKRLGWDEQDIEALASVLKVARDPSRVIVVARRGIVLESDTVVFGHPECRRWVWNARLAVAPTYSLGTDDHRVWCPAHGYGCDAQSREDGYTVACGAIGHAVLDLCGCLIEIGHVPSCPIRAFAEEAEALPVVPEPPPERHYVLNKITTKKRKKHDPLPGQIGLKLEGD